MKGSKRIVPLEEVRASLLTIVTPEWTRRRGDDAEGDTEGGGDDLDRHGEGEEVRLQDERKSHRCLKVAEIFNYFNYLLG
jgi:hypothetical protein